MRYLISLLLVIFSFLGSYSQVISSYDTIIDKGIYKAYYSHNIKTSSFVIYKLYKGGGSTSRKGMSFSGKLPHFDYYKSGYDRGHLVPAKDFSHNKEELKLTFDYINAIPQSPKVNRGIWRVYEKKIRELSQNDSLLIICGGSNYEDLIPKFYWKVVYSLTNQEILYSLLVDYKGNQYSINPRFLERFRFSFINKLYNE